MLKSFIHTRLLKLIKGVVSNFRSLTDSGSFFQTLCHTSGVLKLYLLLLPLNILVCRTLNLLSNSLGKSVRLNAAFQKLRLLKSLITKDPIV